MQVKCLLWGFTADSGLADPLSCVYVYVGMLSTWPGDQGHEPPLPEQEASPQGQLLALKGPTHPWLNAPGLLCPRGCWFYRPIHSIAPQMEGGKERDDLCWRSSSAHAYKQCAHKHTGTACTPCPLNQSVLPLLLFLYKRVFCSCVTRTESSKMSRTFCLLIGYWQQPLPLMLHACIKGKQLFD